MKSDTMDGPLQCRTEGPYETRGWNGQEPSGRGYTRSTWVRYQMRLTSRPSGWPPSILQSRNLFLGLTATTKYVSSETMRESPTGLHQDENSPVPPPPPISAQSRQSRRRATDKKAYQIRESTITLEMDIRCGITESNKDWSQPNSQSSFGRRYSLHSEEPPHLSRAAPSGLHTLRDRENAPPLRKGPMASHRCYYFFKGFRS